jgi:hypothetical protein
MSIRSGSEPPLSVSASMVSTACPQTCAARVRQPRAVRPSISTVQAPQTPCSQPRWVPSFGELQPFAPGERQRCGGAVSEIAQSGEGEMFTCDRLRLPNISRMPAEQGSRRHVFDNGHLGKRLHDLERSRETEPRDLVRPPILDVVTVEAHASRRRRINRPKSGL